MSDTAHGTETDREKAERLASEVAVTNEDSETRREAIEQELEDEGLSDEGEHLGDHIE
ncbi:MAG TPA: hypothetical protein VKA65_05185 [Acidimicrobiales bacterium]|jgi:hypothetical protein|nr:hypothetical protein [Acidimicrobiales bacterium]